jgi:transcription initiation factor TFIID subunit 1
MFNLSNDEYYNPRLSSETSLVDLEGTSIQHSIPAARLHPLWFPTHYSRHMLRNFHRPKLKGLSSPEESTGYFPLYSLTKHAKEMDNEREKERVGSGGGEVFFMRTLDDLTPCDSHLVLFEYCEEHPPLLSNIGMASKVKNYYRRPERQKEAPPHYPYGETSYVLSTSYFLGQLKPGQSLQSLENNMFRAPIYNHKLPTTDFLVIRSGEGLYIRDVSDVFSVGQACPKMEVPGPNSKQDKAFQKDFLTLTLYRLFADSRESPKQLRMDQVKAAFPHLSENVIRKRLKLFANFERFGSDFSNYGCWLLRPDFRLPSEEEIRDLITPEQFCAHASMRSAEQRLKDAGYGGKSLFMEDEDDEDIAQKLDDEILAAPWNTTKHFINAMKGKYLLQINGPADPTGIGEGFSYIRTSSKTTVGKEEGSGPKQPKRSGTDADLRKLHLDKAKNVLRSFGVPEEEISRLSRWEVVDVVRTMSTEAARSGGTTLGSFKFARGRLTHLSAQERYKEECQRVFDLQNKVLGSSELLSTDEDSSDEESEDELTKNLEKFLGKKSSQQVSHEEEELEREELKKLLAQDKKIENKTGVDTPVEQPSRSDTPTNEADDALSVGSSGMVGRRLVITRTFSRDGMEYQRQEVVKNQAVIEAYLKIAKSKDKEQIRLAFAEQDLKAKEDMRKEKKRLQDQLRRIRRMEEKSMHKKPKKEKKIPDTTLKMKCGACGQLGHMKTNKNCPMFKKNPVQVAMTEAQVEAEREAILSRDDLVKVEGTKISFAPAFISHIEDTKKKSLLLKFPKNKLRKRRRQGEDDLEYLGKRRKTVQRRDTNPEVPFSAALERILMKLRTLPESSAFQKPVSVKTVPDYYSFIRFPMDLQTIKENLRQHYYRSREMFLEHVNLIVTNCITYNGFGSELTKNAQKLLEVCTEELQKHEEDLARLECKINPVLDQNACVAFSYILETIINRMKAIPESAYFHNPVSAKQLPDYHSVVDHPMDLESMRKNCKKHRYHTREQFSADVDLIVKNSATYNGLESPFTKTTETMREVASSSLIEYKDTLEQLEAKIIELDNRKGAAAGSVDFMTFEGDATSLLHEEGGTGEDVSLDLDFSSILEDLQTSPQQSEESEEDDDDEEDLEAVIGEEEEDITVDVVSQDTLADSKSPFSSLSQSVQMEEGSSSESELED